MQSSRLALVATVAAAVATAAVAAGFAPPNVRPNAGPNAGPNPGSSAFVAPAPSVAIPAFQEAEKGASDQIYVRSKRDGSVAPVAGRVTKNGLDQVAASAGGKEATYDGALVVRVVWGDAPRSYRDGIGYRERGAFEDAVKELRSAAADGAARDVVKASAQLELAETLVRWGATDPARFVEAATEAQAFLTTYAGNRETPRARRLLGRALWMSGKPAEAGAALKALWSELQGTTTTQGYAVLDCLEAGVHAARALADAKDTLGAREIFTSLESQAGPLAAGAADDDPLKRVYQNIADEAALGAGFVDLAGGQTKQAMTFFQSKVGSLTPKSSHALRFGAQLGLGEALLAEGKFRDAALHLARAAALDPQDADRAARALVKLAECYSKLGDTDARAQACSRVKAVITDAGGTPASLRARQLQKDLGC
jgi:tetratricopeptide (TPR) repeat protein